MVSGRSFTVVTMNVANLNSTSTSMQRLSQVLSHLAQGGNSVVQTRSSSTPLSDHGDPATTNIHTMPKMKVVVTRQLIDEAQSLLDAKKDDLEVVQWQSEKVR
jgi:glyoxylate/hydroxypyruvate reductase